MRQLSGRVRRGFTLVELLVAITISGFVMASLYRVLAGNQRFYRAQSQILDVQENVRAVAQILPGELRALDASDGDIIAMSDTSITFKADRGLRFVCAAPDVANGRITVRNALAFGYRAPDPTRDSLLVLRDGDPTTGTDDRWLRAPIAATGSANCTDGAAGTQYTLTGMVGTGGIAQLGPSGASKDQGVTSGAPVRFFETVRYRLYNDGTGSWWLGVQGYSGGAWGATSPIAGPLRADIGITFRYTDGTGAVTTTPANVRRIRVTVRGQSAQPINVGGRAQGLYYDSLTLRAHLRNNARY